MRVGLVVVACGLLGLAGCGGSGTGGPPPTPTAAMPVFSVAPGTYDRAQAVAITDSTPGAQIYFTADPNSPAVLYTVPVTVSLTQTLYADAIASGYLMSPGATAAYVIERPVANAGGPYAGIEGIAVNFNGSASSSPTGKALTYAWNFGDGSTGAGVSPSHTYSVWGTYTVTLTVTDSNSLTNSATAQVIVPNGRAYSAWVANYTGTVTEVSRSGHFLSGSSGYQTGAYQSSGVAIAVDSHGNAWLAGGSGNLVELSQAGAPLYAISPLYNGIPTGLFSLAIDGADHVWFANGQAVAELSNSGVFLTLPLLGYTIGTLGTSSGPLQLALDGSGDVWAANSGPAPTYSGGVSEFIGLAAPVITPICAGLPATPTADGSSNLGTRP